MTFDPRLVGFGVENLEIWSISYGIHNISYPPTYINTIDFTKGNFDVACSCRWGSTSFFTPTAVNTV